MKSGDTNAVIIDCHHAGIAGNMLLGALLDMGAEEGKVRDEILRCTSQAGQVNMEVTPVRRASVSCLKVEFGFKASGHVHMEECLEKASDPWVRERAIKVFNTLQEAESSVHGKEHGHHPHLHEVGRLDAVADIVGCLTAWKDLGLDRVDGFSTSVAVGGGQVKFSHGSFPVPAPATLEILRGVPMIMGGERELATPTGASLLVNLVQEFNDSLAITPIKIGMGAGSDMEDFLNATRVMTGWVDENLGDRVDVIETSVDDVTPEHLAYCSQKLMTEGALDVSIIPSSMKKGRLGNLVKVISVPGKTGALCDLLLEETGSLGARVHRDVERRKLEREILDVETELGGRKWEIRVKIGRGRGGQILSAKPEYDDVAAICEETGLSPFQVSRAILRELEL